MCFRHWNGVPIEGGVSQSGEKCAKNPNARRFFQFRQGNARITYRCLRTRHALQAASWCQVSASFSKQQNEFSNHSQGNFVGKAALPKSHAPGIAKGSAGRPQLGFHKRAWSTRNVAFLEKVGAEKGFGIAAAGVSAPNSFKSKSKQPFPCSYPDIEVRKMSVKWLVHFSNDELVDYLPQLIVALRHETYENSALAEFMLHRALRSPRFAHYLFWLLSHNLPGSIPQVRLDTLYPDWGRCIQFKYFNNDAVCIIQKHRSWDFDIFNGYNQVR